MKTPQEKLIEKILVDFVEVAPGYQLKELVSYNISGKELSGNNATYYKDGFYTKSVANEGGATIFDINHNYNIKEYTAVYIRKDGSLKPIAKDWFKTLRHPIIAHDLQTDEYLLLDFMRGWYECKIVPIIKFSFVKVNNRYTVKSLIIRLRKNKNNKPFDYNRTRYNAVSNVKEIRKNLKNSESGFKNGREKNRKYKTGHRKA